MAQKPVHQEVPLKLRESSWQMVVCCDDHCVHILMFVAQINGTHAALVLLLWHLSVEL